MHCIAAVVQLKAQQAPQAPADELPQVTSPTLAHTAAAVAVVTNAVDDYGGGVEEVSSCSMYQCVLTRKFKIHN